MREAAYIVDAWQHLLAELVSMPHYVYFECISLVSDDLVSEAMEEDDEEEDITDDLPCTLSIEDSTQDSTQDNDMDRVSFPYFSLF